MAAHLPGNPSQQNVAMCSTSMDVRQEFQVPRCKWYYSRQQIEEHSPSREDGIDLRKESQLRKSYCSFLKELGVKLKVPQVTIACAMMLCHWFYMHQSHGKNDWKTIATVSLFLAGKIEETPCLLRNVIVVAHEIMHKSDPSAAEKIKQRDVYYKQKELILIGERLLLATIAFDFNIQLPYKPLVAALKKLDLSKVLAKEAWNFVNDWLCTTLCLQYKPHYIAAGTVFLVAKLKKVKLPSDEGKIWWHEFDIEPRRLEEVIREMLRLLEWDKKRPLTSTESKALFEKPIVSSANHEAMAQAGGFRKSLAYINKPVEAKEVVACQTSDSGGSSVVEDPDCESQPRPGESDQNSRCKVVSFHNSFSQIDANRIREALKRKKCDRDAAKKLAVADNDGIDGEAWIERELENGIVMESDSSSKRQRNAM